MEFLSVQCWHKNLFTLSGTGMAVILNFSAKTTLHNSKSNTVNRGVKYRGMKNALATEIAVYIANVMRSAHVYADR